MLFEPYDGVFTMSVSAVLFFRSFSTNLHFNCCSALIYFIFIILLLRYFRRVYLQNFTQHHNTTEATTKKRVVTAFFILFTLLSYNISNIVFISSFYLSIMVSYISSTITNSISRNKNKEKL